MDQELKRLCLFELSLRTTCLKIKLSESTPRRGTDVLWELGLFQLSEPSLATPADLPDQLQAILLLGPPVRRGSLGSSCPLDGDAATGRKLSVGSSEQPCSAAQ